MEQLTLTGLEDTTEITTTAAVVKKIRKSRKLETNICKTCNEPMERVPTEKDPVGRWRCIPCDKKRAQGRRDRGEDKTKDKDRALKLRLNEEGGGWCNYCGNNICPTALEFHHIDKDQKSFELQPSEIRGKAWEDILAEMEKCILLCATCHRYEHYLIENDFLTWKQSIARNTKTKKDFFKRRKTFQFKFNSIIKTWYKKIGGRI